MKVTILALFAIAAGIVAVFDLGARLSNAVDILPNSQAPLISIYHVGTAVTPSDAGYDLRLKHDDPIRVQITSNSKIPALIENVSILPVQMEEWTFLEEKIGRPAHGSISIDKYVLKPTQEKEIQVFSIKDGMIELSKNNSLISKNKVYTISSEISDLLLIEMLPANVLFSKFCANLVIKFRSKNGPTNETSTKVCFSLL